MYVFYYKHLDRIHIVACRGVVPGKLSPVWQMPSACAWLIPGTDRGE